MANRLINEQSPYLLQHAHNPVDWYPWGDEAFERAKQEDKPVLVSIGYAACHWCHVMERESFEHDDIAAYMNEHFVCIKVDREEHPDVDHMYMDAVQAISGSGGWPLNVFVTPERVPFYGGTYFPPQPGFNRPSWPQLLERMQSIWHGQQDEVKAQAGQMLEHLRSASKAAAKQKETTWNMDTCRRMADNLLKQADTMYGGFGNAPKFPGTMAISFLLEHYHFTKYEPALKQALLSIDKMIDGGIYDQLGGGFARYSTDAKWLAPHFEKMLYDNALLISCMCDAWSITKNARYKNCIEETIGFIERELDNGAGGYFSAIDADSEGVEGKFYTWTWDEWITVAGANDSVAAAYFGVEEHGNWEETNILHVAKTIEQIAEESGGAESEVRAHIAALKRKLFAVREKRIRPITDDKTLLSWNALMNIALSKAGVVLGNKQYIARATTQMKWLLEAFLKEDGLLHTWKEGVAKIPAVLDDYAYLSQALLQLASASGDAAWILKANELTQQVAADFAQEEGPLFYYTSAKQKHIPVRKADIYDGATPSANAVMAHNLLLCGLCMENSAFNTQAGYMLQNICDTAERYIYSFSYWAILLQRHTAGLKTAVYAGPEQERVLSELQAFFVPQCYIITSKKEISEIGVLENKYFVDKLYIFVCTLEACMPPVSEAGGALNMINA